jgi:hypothetical protein
MDASTDQQSFGYTCDGLESLHSALVGALMWAEMIHQHQRDAVD